MQGKVPVQLVIPSASSTSSLYMDSSPRLETPSLTPRAADFYQNYLQPKQSQFLFSDLMGRILTVFSAVFESKPRWFAGEWERRKKDYEQLKDAYNLARTTQDETILFDTCRRIASQQDHGLLHWFGLLINNNNEWNFIPTLRKLFIEFLLDQSVSFNFNSPSSDMTEHHQLVATNIKLQAMVVSTQHRVTQLQDELKANNRHQHLQETIRRYLQELHVRSARLNELIREKAVLENNMVALQRENQSQSAQIHSLKSQVERLQEQVSKLTFAVKIASDQNMHLKNLVDHVNKVPSTEGQLAFVGQPDIFMQLKAQKEEVERLNCEVVRLTELLNRMTIRYSSDQAQNSVRGVQQKPLKLQNFARLAVNARLLIWQDQKDLLGLAHLKKQLVESDMEVSLDATPQL